MASKPTAEDWTRQDFREQQLKVRQEDLSTVVEPLVDAISELVLCSVTQEYEDLNTICEDISQRTNTVVLIAQQTASTCLDKELESKIAKAIEQIANAIENLVMGFTNVLTQPGPTSQKEFAGAARDVGNCINHLCVVTDMTSEQKIEFAVRDALVTSANVYKAASLGQDALLKAAKPHVDAISNCGRAISNAANATSDPKKKALLEQGFKDLHSQGVALVRMAKEVTLRPSEPTLKKSLEEMNRALTETFTRILEAGRIKAKEFDKVQQTYEYIKQLIESANSMEQYAQELFHTAVTGTEDEFIKVAKLTGTQALDLVRKAEVAQQREPDLVKKQLIREGIAELREASKNMIEASKAVQKNKNDPNARLRLEEAQKRLAEAIRAIRRNVEGEYDESNQGRVAYKAEALESVANQLLRAARRKDVNQVQQDAQTFVSVGHQLVQDAQILLKDITNPAQKKALESDLQQLKLAINRFEQAAKRYAQNPDDPQALQELEDAHKNLFEKINSVKKSAKIIPGFDDKSFEEAAVSIQSMDTSSSKKIQVQLVSAAKEETNAALNLANEAEKNLSQFSGLQRKELEEGIEAIRSLAKEVKSDAEYLESHPHDVKAQERLANSQRRLGAAVEKVIKIHQNHSPSQDVANELNQMGSTTNPSTEVLQQAQQVLDQIGRTFGANANPDPETQMQNAKTLSAQATQLANKLKELAAASQDPIFKEKLLKSSKLLRDGAIQIKILSAVKAAGGEDKSNTVGSSANTLLHTITEAMNDIQSQQLKDRFRNTVKQTMAMNRVASLWKAKAK